MTVTCQAGIRVADLQTRLESAGQRVPFDRYLPPHSTVGGALASNLSGASQHAMGSARDFILGLRIVTAEGRLVKGGGKVVKNVAGYDLAKLFIGSRGTLGVLVEAVFKVQPTPAETREIGLRLNSIAEGCRFASEAHRRGLNLRSVVLINSAEADAYYPKYTPTAVLHLELAGNAEAVERSQAEINDLATSGSITSIEPYVEIFASLTTPYITSLTCTASVRPSDLPGLLAEIEMVVPDVRLIAQPVTGRFRIVSSWVDRAMEDLSRLRGLTEAVHGTLVVENSSDPDLKRRIDVFGDPPPSFPLMRAIKQQFDPNNILSPGRFVGRL
jgi:glycolate oxidase FAD binding subunit